MGVQVASEEEIQAQREQEIASLQEQLGTLTGQLETLEMNMKKYTAGTCVYNTIIIAIRFN